MGGRIEKAAEGAARGLLKIALALVAVGIVIGAWVYLGNNQNKFNQVVQAGGDFASTTAITGLQWGTSKMGGSAAEAAGTEVVYIQNDAPLRWKVGGAIRVWNAGLTNVQLRAVQECPSSGTCFKVSQVSELPDQDGRMVLGRTRTFLTKSISFNGAAVGDVPARSLAVAACHELGHALGAEHRSGKSSCMDAVIGPGVPTRPDAKDFKTVNDKFGH